MTLKITVIIKCHWVTGYESDRLRMWLDTKVTGYQCDWLRKWPATNVTSYESDRLRKWPATNVTCYECDLLRMWPATNVIGYECEWNIFDRCRTVLIVKILKLNIKESIRGNNFEKLTKLSNKNYKIGPF